MLTAVLAGIDEELGVSEDEVVGSIELVFEVVKIEVLLSSVGVAELDVSEFDVLVVVYPTLKLVEITLENVEDDADELNEVVGVIV